MLITTKQLKETNLIFVEHDKLLHENSLLKEQLENYVVENNILIESDSIKESQITIYSELSDSYRTQIGQLNKEIGKKNKAMLGWKIGGVTFSLGLILLLILK